MDNIKNNCRKALDAAQTMTDEGKFELICLPFDPDDLEPVISAETIALHHGKHLQTYVNNLNTMLPNSQYEGMPLEEIVCKADGGVFNNAGQILNHNMYFMQLAAPRKDNRPSGALADAINAQFGSFDKFMTEFTQKGTTLFGSGWVWLSAGKDGSMVISQEQNAQNPVTAGRKPLLCFDVWEHAYYVDYQNRRAEHLNALWQIINWDVVAGRL